MKRHHKLQRDIEELKLKRASTPVSLPKGKYSYSSNLVMQLCAAHGLHEKMVSQLVSFADLMGCGEEYQKVINILKEYKVYLETSRRVVTTGCDWGEEKVTLRREKQIKPDVGTGVFGRTWKEIERMQGGKISLT